jgi:hypothetical protein
MCLKAGVLYSRRTVENLRYNCVLVDTRTIKSKKGSAPDNVLFKNEECFQQVDQQVFHKLVLYDS